jgi:hypothetical protein
VTKRQNEGSFDEPPRFSESDDTGSFLPGYFEAQYEALFAETLNKGPITAARRERLDLAAKALGFDPERVSRLENALLAAYEAKSAITSTEIEWGDTWTGSPLPTPLPPETNPSPPPSFPPPVDIPPPARLPSARPRTQGARSSAPPPPPPRTSTNPPPRTSTNPPPRASTNPPPRASTNPPPPPAWSRTSAPPPSPSTIPPAFSPPTIPPGPDAHLHHRFGVSSDAGALDEQFCAAAVLVRRGSATPEESALYEAYRTGALPQPARGLSVGGWQKLFHPSRDRIVGDILAEVASAVLIGRVTSLRRHNQLPELRPAEHHDPAVSTVSAVRALGWSASTLGLATPPLYVTADSARELEVVMAVPPAIRVGQPLLIGKSSLSLAFMCGRFMSYFRADHFVLAMVPSVSHLEEIFWAALTIGAPHLSLKPELRVRLKLVADTIDAMLEPPARMALSENVRRFLASGQGFGLAEWARGAELTANRAGLLLCSDLDTACAHLATEQNGEDGIRDLEEFWASDDASELRAELGIAMLP